MTRSELFQAVQNQNLHLSPKHIEMAVNHIFEKIAMTLQQGGRVELRGFGIFTTRERPARMARNPKTGEYVSVDNRVVPFFKASKELRDRINGF